MPVWLLPAACVIALSISLLTLFATWRMLVMVQEDRDSLANLRRLVNEELLEFCAMRAVFIRAKSRPTIRPLQPDAPIRVHRPESGA